MEALVGDEREEVMFSDLQTLMLSTLIGARMNEQEYLRAPWTLTNTKRS